jgi:hypothetical protein
MAGIGYGGLAAVTAALSAAVLASIAFVRPRPAIA